MNKEKLQYKNAVIKSVDITNGDHNCLSVWIFLNYGGSEQGFGGYSLYNISSGFRKDASNKTGHFINRVFEIAGVDKWDRLVGKSIRVISNEMDDIIAVGHIVHDDWFYPRVDFA